MVPCADFSESEKSGRDKAKCTGWRCRPPRWDATRIQTVRMITRGSENPPHTLHFHANDSRLLVCVLPLRWRVMSGEYLASTCWERPVADVQLPTLSRGPAGAASESVLAGTGLFRTERTVVTFVLVHYIESNHPYDEMLFNNGASLKLTEDCTGGGSPPQAVVFHQSTGPPEAGRCTLLRSFSPPTALAPRPATDVSLSACRSRHDATRQRRR